MEKALTRTPRLRNRLFTTAERDLPVRSLAARFAAKEAAAKAVGSPGGLSWHDCEVVKGHRGRPSLRVSGALERLGREQGVKYWHVSLTHDGGVAGAVVIAES